MAINEHELSVGDVVKFYDNIEDDFNGIPNASEFAGREWVVSEIFNDADGESFFIEDDEDEWYWSLDAIECITSYAEEDKDHESFDTSDMWSYIRDYQ